MSQPATVQCFGNTRAGRFHLGKHKTGHEFQINKRHGRLLEAINCHGGVLPSDGSQDIVEEAGTCAAHMQTLRAARQRKEERIQGVGIPEKSDLQDLSVYIEDYQNTNQHMTLLATELHWTVVDEPQMAQFFIVNNPLNPGYRVEWAAALLGAWLLTPNGLLSPKNSPERRFAMKCIRAVSVQRIIWVSDAWQLENPFIWKIISDVHTNLETKWNFLSDVGTFALRKQSAMDKKRSAMVIALVTDHEHVVLAASGTPHIFAHTSFFTICWQIRFSCIMPQRVDLWTCFCWAQSVHSVAMQGTWLGRAPDLREDS